jgi:hypothetical protein
LGGSEMKRYQKLEQLRKKYRDGEPITVLFPSDMNSNIDGYKCKCKTGPFENYIMSDKRFKVIETKDREEYSNAIYDVDLVFPPLLYAQYSHLNDPDLYDELVIERKMMFIRYSLGWHIHVNQIYNAQACLVFCDLPELIQKPYHVLTGHPWAEVLRKPKEQFNDPWQTTGKKRILICPHWTLQENTYTKYGNKTNFLEIGDDLI